jgi:hypothetical protein
VSEDTYIRENAEEIRNRLARAAQRVGIPTPTLVAVTKSGTVEQAVALVKTGLIDHVAENRVQMFLERQDAIWAAGLKPHFHLIGSLQTNKVKYIADRVDLIQSLDSLHLAQEIERQAAKKGTVIDCLIEINSGREEAKGGVLPEDAEELLAQVAALSHLRLRGLMTMAPLSPDPEDSRPFFRQTRVLFEKLSARGVFGEAPILSMGMSDSYEVATEEGATMVRVGRAFFRHDS